MSWSLVKQGTAVSTVVFGVRAANWCSRWKIFHWNNGRPTVKLTTGMWLQLFHDGIKESRVQFKQPRIRTRTNTYSFERSRDLRQPALRIPRLDCMLTHEANPGCAVRTNLLWTSLRQITATKLQHTLPPVNWLFSIAAAAAGFASLSHSADTPSTSSCFFTFLCSHHTYSHSILPKFPQKCLIEIQSQLQH